MAPHAHRGLRFSCLFFFFSIVGSKDSRQAPESGVIGRRGVFGVTVNLGVMEKVLM